VNVSTIPYPASFSGPDTLICYGDTAQLHASMTGNTFSWLPSATLSDASILDPRAFPLSTTTYTLRVSDNLGCPKPGISRITVNVEAKILANGGNDTAIVMGQPLQLHASGAPFFSWWPARGLNHNSIHDPIAVLNDTITYFLKAYDKIGCFGLDTIHIKVYKTAPDILVPNAFTPGKNTNAVFRPITLGIASLEFFRVYNRWGQLVFSTAEMGKGWDGTIGSSVQASSTYVWMVRGKDYTGKVIAKQGTVVLIR
jgi:gliding motility-associated-like protein